MPSSLTRRRFLERSTVVASAAWIGSHALGAQADEPAAPASERVRLGVMGLKNRGEQLVSGFAALPHAEIVWLCDVDQQVLDGVAAKLKDTRHKPQTTADVRHILDDKNVDALVIAAPDHWHAPATVLACAAGKHVYVEKPAAHNGREGELMVAAARKHSRVVQMGNQRRSSSGVREAIQRLHSGEIGTVRMARSWINSTRPSIGRRAPSAPPTHLNFTLWQGPAPDQPYRDNVVHYHWHWFWHWGTGELGNNGIHGLDLARWGLGVEVPERAVSSGGKLFFDDDQESPDTQLATFHFGQKLIAWEHRTWHKRGFEEQSFGVTFYGDKGALVVGTSDYRILDMDGKELAKHALNTGEREHQENFLAGIRAGEKLNSEIQEGVNSTLLCQLGNIAFRTGRAVEFDAAARTLRGEADQRALWQRDYRPGWEPVV